MSVDEMLRSLQRTAAAAAWAMAEPRDRDDAAQEGVIHAWEVMQRRPVETLQPGSALSYYASAVRSHIKSYVSRGKATGSEKRGAYGAKLVLVDQEFLEGSQPAVHDTHFFDRELPKAVIAVRWAVRQIPARDQDIVYRRYWKGDALTKGEALILGRQIKPQLRELLQGTTQQMGLAA